MNITPSEIKKILCIKPRGIGDIVLSTIILENLKAHYTNAKIDYLTEHFAKDAVFENPLINNVISFEKNDIILQVILKVRKEKYDMIIDLWSNPKTAQITFFSGAKYRVGYSYRGRKYAYNLLGTSSKGTLHSAEHNLELLKPLGVPVITKNIHFNVGKTERNFADNFFSLNKLNDELTFGIIPSGGWESKRCNKEKWVEICNESVENFNCKILVLWGPGDERDAEYIQSNLQKHCLLAPKSTIPQMAAMISRCALVIANDSGPMHISAALGVPTLGIFGPTNPKAHGPYSNKSNFILKNDLDCIVCNRLDCPYNHECMKDLNVNLVLEKVTSLLNL